MPTTQPTLLGLLQRLRPSESARRSTLEDARSELCLSEQDGLSPVCVAYALMKLRAAPEEVSRLLTWRQFESLAAALLRVSGFEVQENVHLRKPRAQIDIVARGSSLTLSVDCKHYRRSLGQSALSRFARAQIRRSELLKAKNGEIGPVASVILSMSEPEGRFVDGVAVVPVRTLKDFANRLDSYSVLLDVR